MQPLLAPFAGAWLLYVALGALLHSQALRIFDAGTLPALDVLRNAALALAPDALLEVPRQSAGGTLVIVLYVAVACLALVTWVWAVRLARTLEGVSSGTLLGLTLLLASPVVVFAGLFSDDVYLYNLYGRTIVVHGANPLVAAPAAFPHDPHLAWVHWKELASSYGPLWLMVSAPLSAVAGDSLSGVIVVYRLAALALHLCVAAALWMVLRQSRPSFAAAGTLFYAWNPLVLVEVVGNAHNDVLVALFAVLVVAAASRRAWATTAFLTGCALMVKPFAVLLVPPVAMRMAAATPPAARMRTFAGAAAVSLATMAALSLPLWAGAQLLVNIRSNPAAHAYTNTLWESLAELVAPLFGATAAAVRYPYLDAVRLALFAAAVIWVVSRRWAPRRPAHAAFALWVAFTLCVGWLWPWYFVPAIALAAAAGRLPLAIAAAMTAGGLLFWAIWTPPPFSPLHPWRAVVLLGPLMLTLTWAPARRLVLDALGSGQRLPARATRAVKVRLQTAEG
ncbi:MAG TPA: hypothetical protein VM364_17785 [Vicinamibacterales bacterium]|nr:hypothetical protein [Vicinamibacterales bacterium]